MANRAITEAIAAQQLRRLRGLPGFADREEILPETIAMLWRQADDEAHCKRAVDALMASCKFFPTPAEVKEACDGTRMDREGTVWQPNLNPCPECNGTRFRTVEKGGYSAAEPCPCGDGKAKKPTRGAA